MIFSLFVAVMVLLCAMFAVRQGLFSGVIMFIETTVACMVAFAFYEPLYELAKDSIGPGIGEPMALMILFGATLLGLRMASDKLIPGNVRVHMYLDWSGGALCGLFAGLILVGTSADPVSFYQVFELHIVRLHVLIRDR